MSALILILASVVASTLAAPSAAPACVPDQTQFYWKSPCDGQTFTNRVQVNSVTAKQNGVPVDENGGMDISINLDLHGEIVDQYGEVAKPLIDITVSEYTKDWSGKCTWKSVPTMGLLSNLDACTIGMTNCHLTGNPTVLDASISIKQIAGPLYAGIDVNTYYGLTFTFKDSKTPFLCIYSQDLVIKK